MAVTAYSLNEHFGFAMRDLIEQVSDNYKTLLQAYLKAEGLWTDDAETEAPDMDDAPGVAQISEAIHCDPRTGAKSNPGVGHAIARATRPASPRRYQPAKIIRLHTAPLTRAITERKDNEQP